MLSEHFLCLCFGSFLKSENQGLPTVTWHCQFLFDAFSPDCVVHEPQRYSLSRVEFISLLHILGELFLHINMKYYYFFSTFSQQLPIYMISLLVSLPPHPALFFFLVSICLVHIFQPFISNFLVFSEFHVECIIAFLYYLSVCQLADKF